MFDAPPLFLLEGAPTSALVSAPSSTAPEPPDEVIEDGRSPVYYRVPPGTSRLPFRFVLGGAYRPQWTEAKPRGAFALALDAGFPTNLTSLLDRSDERSSPLAWIVHLGYAYATFSEHLGLLGFGPQIRVFTPSSSPLE